MKKRIFYLLSIFSFAFTSCYAKETSSKSISIVNWNVQTFFDGNNDGIEYSEFQKSSRWGQDAYKTRLLKLCSAIKEINADIFVFEEIENAGIIYDISNQLAGNSWNNKNSWNYSCFAKNPKDAIGCAVISKFPLLKMTIHNLDIRTEKLKQPSMRPILKVEFSSDEKTYCLLVNHWKSKSSGAEESEIWRKWQESVLCSRFLENLQNPVVACGDFNKDISEFTLLENTNINSDANLLLSQSPNVKLSKILEDVSNETYGLQSFSEVYSPWKNAFGLLQEPGSYYYDSKWERIDHFFANEKVLVSGFSVITNGEWCDENLIPKRYKIYSGEGFSDHLPIKCLIE